MTCTKRKFYDWKSAYSFADMATRNYGERHHAYLCPQCRAIHIGHDSGEDNAYRSVTSRKVTGGATIGAMLKAKAKGA